MMTRYERYTWLIQDAIELGLPDIAGIMEEKRANLTVEEAEELMDTEPVTFV